MRARVEVPGYPRPDQFIEVMHSIAIFISRSYHSIGDLKSKGLKIIGVQCPIESHFASRTGNLLLSC